MSIHILIRRSFTLSTSHALAWQTTSRSRGFTNNDLSQNVGGRAANPISPATVLPYRQTRVPALLYSPIQPASGNRPSSEGKLFASPSKHLSIPSHRGCSP